jgi:hypothetical protein
MQSRIGAAAQCLGRDKGCVAKAIGKNTDPNLVAPDQLSGVLLLADLILPVIALIGVFTTLAALRGVRAANEAIRSIWVQWGKFAREQSDFFYLALDITRGGCPPVQAAVDEPLGADSPRLLNQLRFFWCCVLTFSIVLAITWNSPTLSKWLSNFIEFHRSMISQVHPHGCRIAQHMR